MTDAAQWKAMAERYRARFNSCGVEHTEQDELRELQYDRLAAETEPPPTSARGVTDAMVKAACAEYHDAWELFDPATKEWHLSLMRRVLEAAEQHRAASGSGATIAAFRWVGPDDSSDWYDASQEDDWTYRTEGWHKEYAYTTPPPAASGPVVPEGWVLVPDVPTRRMIDTWRNSQANLHSLETSYCDMLAAAPRVTDETGEGK